MNASVRILLCTILFVLGLLGNFTVASAQSEGDYRSHQSGLWSATSTWDRYTSGSWVNPASAAPSFNDGAITIQSGHAIQIATAVSVDQLTINSGAQLTDSVGTLTVVDGTGVDMLVNGTLVAKVAVSAGGQIEFGNGGVYQHAHTGQALLVATWDNGSTCLVTGLTSATSTTNTGQSFYNFTWNCSGQSATNNMTIPDGTTYRGDFTVTNTNAQVLRLVSPSSAARTFSITGNLNYNNSTAGQLQGTGTASSNMTTINIGGNLSITGLGTVSLIAAAGPANWNLSGNFSMSSGTFSKNGTANAFLNFAKSGTQTFTKTGGTLSAPITVNNGSTLNFGTNVLDGTGTFTLSSGATFEGASASGLAGNITTTGLKTFAAGANYMFDNTSGTQSTGIKTTNYSWGNPANITFNKTTGSGFSIDTSFTATGTVQANGTVNTNSNNVTINGTFQLNEGAWATGNTLIYGSGATLVFNNSSGSYGVGGDAYWPSSSGPANVTVQNSGGITMNVSRTISGTLTTSAGITTGNNLTLNGAFQLNSGGYINGAPTYGGSSSLKYNTGGTYGRGSEWNSTTPASVQLSNSTTLNYPNAGVSAQTLTGNLTIDAGSALYMDYGSPGGSFGALTVNGTVVLNGSLSLGNGVGGDLHVGGNFTNAGTLNSNSRAVEFNGSSAQSVTGATTFAYLTLSNTAGLTLNNNVGVSNTLTFNNGKISTGSNTLTIGSGGTISGAGSGKYVYGNLAYTLPASGSPTVGFEIGDASNYTPVSVVLNSLSSGGTLTAKSTAGSHPQIASALGINSAKSVSRYWTITNSGTAFTDYSATFNFVAGDLTGSPTTSNFVVGKYNGSSWSYPTVGTKASTSTQITGATSFSDFAIGEQPVTYTLTVNAANGTVAKAPDLANYNEGSSVTLTPAASTGYHFVSWSGDVVSGHENDNPLSVTMDANKTITANFAIDTHTLTINASHGSVTLNPATGPYNYGTWVSLTPVPDAGYHFTGWSGDLTGSNSPDSVQMTVDRTVTASFAINTYTITPTVHGTGTLTPATAQTVNYGADEAFTFGPGTGYHFDSLLVDGAKIDSSTSYTFSNVTANHSIDAYFSINYYTLTVNISGSGSVGKDPSAATYAHGTSVQLTATPDAGNSFVGWSGDLTGSTNPTSVTMDGNKTVTATFSSQTYTLSVSGTNGSVTKSPDQGTYTYHTQVTLTPVPATGYHFTNWSGDLTGSTNPATVYTDSNMNVTGNFAINTYTLTLNASHGTVTPSPAGATYNYGTWVTLTPAADAGYHFTGWSGDLTGSANPDSVQMNADRTVTANFAINTYTITPTVHGSGSTTPATATAVDHGANQQFTYSAGTGYHFDSIVVDGVTSLDSVASCTFTNVTTTHSIDVYFSPNTYTVTAGGTNGSVDLSPAGGSYLYGSSVTLTPTPDAGYVFSSWSGDFPAGHGTDNPLSVTVDGNKSITANFVFQYANFRTHQTGNWNDVNTWEMDNGSGYMYPASATPSSTDGTVALLNGHTVTVTADVSVDQVTVNSGASLIVAATKTLTVADGADSIDLVVNGTLNMFGTITSTGRISAENNAIYLFSVPAGGSTMPTITFRTGSTCRIDSSTGSTPSNLNSQTLYNLIVNATTAGANGGPNFPDGYTIWGDLTVMSTKSLQWRLINLNAGNIKSVNIKGNVTVTGSTALLTATGSGADSTAKAIVNVDGNVSVSAGQLSLNNSGSAYSEWHIKGNLSVTGGTLQSGASGWGGRRLVDFNGGGSHSFTVTSPGTLGSAATTWRSSNGTAVTIGFPWTLGAGSFVNLGGGTFVTTSTNILTVPATASVTGGSSSSYVNGPLAMQVASTSTTSKTFPVGKGSAYRPMTLSVNQDAATATTYTAELFNSAPTSRTLPAALGAVSSVRYMNVTKGSGAGISPTLGATIQMSYDTDDNVADATNLRIAKDDGAGNWANLGGSGTANTTGSITSNAFYSFSDFVLATADTSTHAVAPTVSTTSITDISTMTATGGGNVSNDGGAAVTVRGVCWNTTGAPTPSGSHTSDGNGNGVFTSSLTGLTPGQMYYVRAYAVNSADTGYGSEVTFTALSSIVAPTVTTTSISSILTTSAVSGGNVTDWGGASVTVRGICWNTTGSPTTANSHSTDGSGLGTFTSGLAPLTAATTYYVRAYATNSAGTGYGSEISFTTSSPQPDTTVYVAGDGSGNYLTVGAAFRAVPSNYTGKWTIFVKNGTYYEKDTLATGKINVVLQGESRDNTIITYDDYGDRYGSGVPGTSGTFTVAIDASDFVAKDITIRNTYAPQVGVVGTQAVALRTQGDRHQYINCNIQGYQDTYYAYGGSGTGRRYFRSCTIEGTVDFIFGRDIVVFDSCTIHELRNSATMTAASTDPASLYGLTFRNCTIVADSVGYDGVVNSAFYLGRPWQSSPRTVFINTYEPSNLSPAGWQTWNVTPALYAEGNCYGPGSATGSRIISSQLSNSTSANYSLTNIFAKASASSSQILYDWMPENAMTDAPLVLRLTASAGANGSITASGITPVVYNGSKTYTITPNSGYHVADVLVDGSSVGAVTSYSFTNTTTNRTISATFAQNTYTITPTAHGNGTLTPATATSVIEGASQQFTYSASTGSHFDSLYVDGVKVDSSSSYTFTNVTAAHSIDAYFSLNTYTVNVNATNGSVTLNPPSGPYTYGQQLILSATPNGGYNFTGWSGDISGSNNPDTITVTSNLNVTANFAGNTFALTVSGTNGSVTKSPDQASYPNHTQVTLTAVPATGYHFTNWSGDLTGSTNPATVFTDSVMNITANFAINTYTLTVNVTNGSVALNPASGPYAHGTWVYLNATANSGYHFVNYSGDLTSSSAVDSIQMTADKTVTATMAQDMLTSYRSHQTGNWSSVNTWERNANDGTGWVYPASAYPTLRDSSITVQSGHNVTVDIVRDTVDNLSIASGGTVTIASADTLYINDGPGTDLSIDGSVVANQKLVLMTGSSMAVNSGGTYQHAFNGGSIPLATWNTGSTCNVTGVTSTAPSNANQNFYNLTWNCPSQSTGLNLGWQAGPVTIGGTFTVTSTGWNHGSNTSPTSSLRYFGATGAKATVNNLVVNGYNAYVTTAGSAGFVDTLVVNGNVTLSAGGMFSASNNTTMIGVYQLKGDLTVIDSAYIGKSNGANTSTFYFMKGGTQTVSFPATGVTFVSSPNWVDTSGSTVNLGTSVLSSTGSFRVASGATLGIGHANGINGNITTTGANGGGNSFSASANYTYNGTAAQVTGALLPSSVNNLTINNAAGVTLSGANTVNGTLTFTQGNLTTGANAFAVGSTGSVSRTSGHVVGALKLNMPAGATSKTFTIGDASNYTPVSVAFGNVSTAGDLTASTTSSEHPQISSSTLNSAKSVNRYYTLTNSGIAFDNYSATFNYGAGDIDGGASTSSFVVGKYSGGGWTYPTVGTKTATSTQITGATSFSDFAIAESQPMYTLGVTSNHGTVTPNPTPGPYLSGTVVSLTAVAATGYTFTSWSGDVPSGHESDNPLSITMDANKTLTANYTVNTYAVNVTIVGNGTVTKDPATGPYAYGSTVTLTAVPDGGASFVGWSGDTTTSANPLTITVTGAKNVTATFASNTYTINASGTNGSVTKTPDQASYTAHEQVILHAVPNTGYHFTGWSGNVTGSNNPDTVYADSNMTVSANFAIDTHSLTINAVNGSVTPNPVSGPYNYGTWVTLTASPNTGYHFTGWSGDLSGSANPDSVQMTADRTVTANFAINTFTITPSVNGTGTITPATAQTVNYGASQQFTYGAGTGQHFDSLLVDGVKVDSSTSYTFTNVTANHSIAVYFSPNYYSLTVNATNGSVDKNPSAATYAYGSSVTLTPTANPGYQFNGWTGDVPGGHENDNPLSVTIDANKNITANFAAATAVRYSNGTGGGSWLTASTWQGGNVPVKTDSVVIRGTDSVYFSTITRRDTVAALTLLSGGRFYADTMNVTGTLTLNSGSLYINNNSATLPGSTRVIDNASTVDFRTSSVGGAGNLEFGNVIITRSTGSVPGGNLIIHGDLTINNNVNGTTFRGLTQDSVRVHEVYGNVYVNRGTFSAVDVGGPNASCTWNIHGDLISAPGTAGDARIGPFTSASAQGIATINVMGNCTLDGARLQYGASSTLATGTGIINLYKDFTFTNRSTVTTNASATSVFAINFKGSGTLQTVRLDTNIQFGSSGSSPNITQSTFNDTVAAGANVLFDFGSHYWRQSGLTASSFVVSGTLAFKDSSRIKGYGNFDLKSGGTVKIGSPDGLVALPDSTHGNIQNTNTAGGTRTFSTGAGYEYNGSTTQPTGDGLPATVSSLTVNNAAGVNLSAPATVNGSLGLSSGILRTAGNALTVSGTGSVTRTSGYVFGTLSQGVTSGWNGVAKQYPVGDSLNYTPVSVTFTGVTTPGALSAVTAGGEHSQIGTSGLDQTKSVNRSYTLSASEIAFSNYAATFNFVPGDIDAGANTAAFVVKKLDDGVWTSPAMGAVTSTSASITGATSFSEFAIGELLPANQYAVNVSVVGSGTAVKNPDLTSYHVGDTLYITATPATGWSFIGWSGSGTSGSANPLMVIVDTAKNITATFTINTYALNITSVNGSVAKVPDASNYNYHTSVQLTASPASGYFFSGWTGAFTGSTNPLTVVMDSAITLTANFSLSSHTITATAGAHGTISPSGAVSVSNGSNQSFTFSPSTGYHVDSVSVDGAMVDSTTGYTFTNVTAAHTITVTFAINTYTITATAGSNGSISPSGAVNVTYGAGQSFTITPATGYVIDSLLVDNAPVTVALSYGFVNVASNHTIHAAFRLSAAYSARFRTFKYDSLVVKTAIKKKVVTEYWQFRIPYTGTTAQNALNISFKNDVKEVLNVNHGFTAAGTKKAWALTGGTLSIGDTLVVTGRSLKPKAQSIVKLWYGAIDKTADLVKLNPAADWSELPMPNAATIRDEAFALAGIAKANPLSVGIIRVDSPKYYGWVAIAKSADMYKSLEDKSGRHTSTGLGFDLLNGKPFLKGQTSLPPAKHNDKTFADLLTLKFNIILSQLGVTQRGLAELRYSNPSSSCNGLLLSQIAAKGDSLMTLHTGHSAPEYAAFDSVLTAVNGAFSGPIDTTSWKDSLRLSGVTRLIDVPFLTASGVAASVIVPQYVAGAAVEQTPDQFELYQNYPNPFNPATTIRFSLPVRSIVTVKVFNLLGQEVANLADRQQYDDGEQELSFNAANLPSGVYFCRIIAEGAVENEDGTVSQAVFQTVRKMMLIK